MCQMQPQVLTYISSCNFTLITQRGTYHTPHFSNEQRAAHVIDKITMTAFEETELVLQPRSNFRPHFIPLLHAASVFIS